MRYLFLPFLSIFLLVCACDRPRDPEGCRDFDQLTGCIELSTLDSAAHAAAIIGTWGQVNRIFTEVGEIFDDDAGNDCRVRSRDQQSWTFNENGTFLFEDPDFSIDGTWMITTTVSPEGVTETAFVRTGLNTRRQFDHVCDNNEAYIDERDRGGEYRRYVRQ